MMESIEPSPELLNLLVSISHVEIHPDIITKHELKNIVGNPSRIDISTVEWPPEPNALVGQVTKKAVEESNLKIKQLAPKSKGWHSNTYILRKGSIAPFEGNSCLIIPLLRTPSSPTRVVFHHAKKKPGEPEEWKQRLYLLGTDMCITAMEGELVFIGALCE
ncbi:hypothetical protein HD806DRAFT_499607 [Xylariaceae sp. AK1471]|nr:hypothetical protein HD806DRAFT_499607 [Xylariaceae sp. AK1471]